MECSYVLKGDPASWELDWRESNRVALVGNFIRLWHQALIHIGLVLQIWKAILIFLLCISPASVVTVRLTGAGDCLVGGKLASICAGLNFMQCGIWNCSSQSCCWGRDVHTAFSLATIIGMCSHIAFTIISLNDVWKFVLYEVDNEIGFYFAGYWYPHWNIFSLVDELGVKPFTNWTTSWQNSWEGLSPAFFYLLVWWRFDMQIFSQSSNSIDFLISVCS